VTALFADTFYWAALTSTEDKDHARAMDFSRSLRPEKIVTTDEVLTEYLAFFSGAKSSVRLQAGNNVDALLRSSAVLVIPQSRESFLAGLELYRGRLCRQTARPSVPPCTTEAYAQVFLIHNEQADR
jgi:uncharacterized protein